MTAPRLPVLPPFDPEREVRFAVVLYGGVSLAIYINGVVQELFRLVRSTAPVFSDQNDPSGEAYFPSAAVEIAAVPARTNPPPVKAPVTGPSRASCSPNQFGSAVYQLQAFCKHRASAAMSLCSA